MEGEDIEQVNKTNYMYWAYSLATTLNGMWLGKTLYDFFDLRKLNHASEKELVRVYKAQARTICEYACQRSQLTCQNI